MNPPSFLATTIGSANVFVTQNTPGSAGNTEITFPDGDVKLEFYDADAEVYNFFSLGVDGTPVRRDNMHFNTPIPGSDFQYSWINSAINGSNWENDQVILTYAPKNGLISSSAGITEALVFPSSSLLYGE